MWWGRENVTPIRNQTSEPITSLIDLPWLMVVSNMESENRSKGKYYY
jgi:hypothetical protein